jgi:hypothetical protein
MNLVNINPGLRSGMRQPFTIMTDGQIFFLTHNESSGQIEWNMFMDDPDTKLKIEKILRDYLTNR